MEQTTQQPMEQVQENKSNLWYWVLGILILVVIGIIIYVVFSGGSDGGAGSSAGSLLGGSNSIPQPPALPSD